MEEFENLRPLSPIIDRVAGVECALDIGDIAPSYSCDLTRWSTGLKHFIYNTRKDDFDKVIAENGAEVKSGMDDTKSLLITTIEYPDIFSCREFGNREGDRVLKCKLGSWIL